MQKKEFNELVRKALLLETKNRTKFLEGIEDLKIKKDLAFILSDDTKNSDLDINTSAGLQSFEKDQFKVYETGHTINQFTIVKLIATGGMGCVYLAFDNKLNRNVAIKTIRPEYLKNKISQQRLKIEAQILSQINTSSICQIYDYIETEDGDLLVLELLDGETLNKLSLNNDEQIDVFFQVASGLEIAHAKGVIHRDLKPDNIMIAENNEVKILDFGIAKSIDKTDKIETDETNNSESNISLSNITTVGSLIGTLLYMSPEQASMKEITTASDVYSLGIMMIEMLTGKNTYQINDTKDFVEQIKNAEVLNLEYLPKEFIPIINSMINKDPLKRPTASEVKNSLVEIRNLPKQIKKRNKSILFSIVLLSLVLFSLFQWNKYKTSQEMNQLVLEIEQDINQIPSAYQKIYTLPLHNITKDLASLANKKNNLLKHIKQSDLLPERKKNLYSGQIYLAHRDYKKSLPLLEKAWSLGVDTQELAGLLFFNNVVVYYKNSHSHYYSEGFSDKEYLMEQSDLYLTPANKYLPLSKINMQSNSIPKAILLWHKRDYVAAVDVLEQLIDEEDWNYEAYQIQGEILHAAGISKYENGEIDESLSLLKKSIVVFKKASDRGRSFAKSYTEMCIINTSISNIISDRTKDGVDSQYLKASKSCENSLLIFPENNQVYNAISRLNVTYANFNIRYGKNPLAFLDKSIEASEFIQPEYRKHMAQAHAYTITGNYEDSKGSNPLASFEKAIESYNKAILVKDNSIDLIYSNIIYVYIMKMSYEHVLGVNPVATINRLKQLEKHSIKAKVSSNDAKFIINISFAKAYGFKAYYQVLKNIDPFESIKLSEKHIELSRKFDETNPYIDGILAETYVSGIKYNTSNNKNSNEVLLQALSLINNSLKSYPKNPDFLDQKATILAEYEYSKNLFENYKVDFKNAHDLYQQALEQNPKSDSILSNLSELYFNQAKLGITPKHSLEKGIELSNKAIEINPNYSFAYFIQANLLKFGVDNGHFNKERLVESDRLYTKAQSINPLLIKP